MLERSHPSPTRPTRDVPAPAVVRSMADRMDRPQAIQILAPLLIQELSYWLLVGPAGGMIIAMTAGTRPQAR
ncbi:AraC family transcriptional regulator N-terminal domain-containing protein [Gibbsiella quercinecans]|uniref:AraC family transcriptional regulator N-terminal domain-containing protein n=1 Tax=Gibbsiella quercinecans TaxID=929813 RepID=UPI000BB09839